MLTTENKYFFIIPYEIPYWKGFRTTNCTAHDLSAVTWKDEVNSDASKHARAVISDSLNEEHKGFKGKRHSHWIYTDTHSLLAHKNSFLTAKKNMQACATWACKCVKKARLSLIRCKIFWGV